MVDVYEFNVINLDPPRPPRSARLFWLCVVAGSAYLAFAGFMAYLAVMWQGLAGVPVR